MGTVPSLDLDKMRAAVVYLASQHGGGIDKYRAGKLLFLADKYHLVRYGRSITGDVYWALPHGPAPTNTLDLLNALINDADSPDLIALAEALEVDRRFQHPRFRAKQEPDWSHLSRSDIEALDETLRRYRYKRFDELKALTHETVAYQRAWERRGTSQSAPMDFEDFFEEDGDAISGVLEEFREDAETRKALSDW